MSYLTVWMQGGDTGVTSRHFFFVASPPPPPSFAVCRLVVAMAGQSEKLVSGKSAKKADRTTGGKYLDKKGNWLE